MKKKNYGENTKIAHLGQKPDEYYGVVNPPIVHASTILFPDLESYEKRDRQVFQYARYGTPLSKTYEQALAAWEGGFDAIAAPCGLSAITTSFLAFSKTGDHVLVTDSLYPPARTFCSNVLTRMGIEVEYYDPCIGVGISKLIKRNTAFIHMESPGSATFEVQDVESIVAVAKKKKIVTIFDNSWSGGFLFKPFQHGVDVVLQSVSKYIGGHSDIMLGISIGRNKDIYTKLKTAATHLGVCAGPEDMYYALRGLRTLPLRMKQCGENALKIAKFLEGRKEVQKVYYPGLARNPHHRMWKKYYNGANGLLSFLLQPASKKAVAAFCDGLEFFPIGSSWGGYESLLQPQYLKAARTAVPWTEKGMLLRIHVGLEDPEDLIADLEAGFKRFNRAR
ncbi:MAG: cystathionine beta-lyase [Alphaproteobacteria bacterium]